MKKKSCLSNHHPIESGKATAEINGRTYKLVFCKKPIMQGDVRCLSIINHDKCRIEFDPEIPAHRLPSLIAKIVCAAWVESIAYQQAVRRPESLPAGEMVKFEGDFEAFVRKVGL